MEAQKWYGVGSSVDEPTKAFWSTRTQDTVAINELLCMKNASAQIAMDFS